MIWLTFLSFRRNSYDQIESSQSTRYKNYIYIQGWQCVRMSKDDKITRFDYICCINLILLKKKFRRILMRQGNKVQEYVGQNYQGKHKVRNCIIKIVQFKVQNSHVKPQKIRLVMSQVLGLNSIVKWSSIYFFRLFVHHFESLKFVSTLT